MPLTRKIRYICYSNKGSVAKYEYVIAVYIMAITVRLMEIEAHD